MSETVTQTVLFLGEESPHRQVLAEDLCRRGYRVVKAKSAGEARKALHSQPGMVLVDQCWSNTSGIYKNRAALDYRDTWPVVKCSPAMYSINRFNALFNLLKLSLIVFKAQESMDSLSENKAIGVFSAAPALTGPLASQPRLTCNKDGEPMPAWMSDQTIDFETRQALEDLGHNYLADMPETLYKLRSQVEAALVSSRQECHIKEAANTAHRIRGTAGCLGFARLSSLAGGIESILDQVSPAGSAVEEQDGGLEQSEELKRRQAACDGLARALLLIADIEGWLEAWQDQCQQYTVDQASQS